MMPVGPLLKDSGGHLVMVGVTEDRMEAHCSCSPTSPSFGPLPLLVVVG